MGLSINGECLDTVRSVELCIRKSGGRGFIHGAFLREQLRRDPLCNHEKRIDVTLSVNPDMDKLSSVISSVFPEWKPDTSLVSSGYSIQFWCVPEFEPEKPVDHGFTVDHLYYEPSTNKLFDSTGSGEQDITAETPVARAVQWNDDTPRAFAIESGIFGRVHVPDEQMERLRSTVHVARLDVLLWTPRPGSAYRFTKEVFPNGAFDSFASLLLLAGGWAMTAKEGTSPGKVLDDEKLKLIDVYSEYFFRKRTGTRRSRSYREKILMKILLGE